MLRVQGLERFGVPWLDTWLGTKEFREHCLGFRVTWKVMETLLCKYANHGHDWGYYMAHWVINLRTKS